TCPSLGSASGRTIGPMGGKLCSHSGSCTTTGTISHRLVPAVSQAASSGTTPRKSETMKAKGPDDSSARKRGRKASPRAGAASGVERVCGGVARPDPGEPRLDSLPHGARGRRKPKRLAAARSAACEVEIGDGGGRRRSALDDQLDCRACRRRLRKPRKRRRVD